MINIIIGVAVIAAVIFILWGIGFIVELIKGSYDDFWGTTGHGLFVLVLLVIAACCLYLIGWLCSALGSWIISMI